MRLIIFILLFIASAASADMLNCGDAVARALKNNPQHLKAKWEKDAAFYRKWEAVSNRLPSVKAGYTSIRYDEEIVFPVDSATVAVIQPLTMGQNSIDITWPLFTGGALTSAQKIAEKSYRASDLMLDDSRENTKLETVKAYYNLIKMNGILSISRSAGELVDENIKMVNRMFDLGLAQKKDVLRVQVSSAEVRQQIQQAEQGVQLSRVNLNMVMGEPLDSEFELDEHIPQVDLDKSFDELLKFALENRPALRSARIGSDMARLGVKAARSSLLPTVAAVYHWQKDTEASLFGDGQSWRAMLNVSIDLPLGQSNLARIGSARAQYRQSRYSVAEAENGVRMEVESNYLQYMSMKSSLDLASQQVAFAEENYQAVVSGFEQGESSQIELIDARNSLVNARINLMNTQIDHYILFNQLMVSCGYPLRF